MLESGGGGGDAVSALEEALAHVNPGEIGDISKRWGQVADSLNEVIAHIRKTQQQLKLHYDGPAGERAHAAYEDLAASVQTRVDAIKAVQNGLSEAQKALTDGQSDLQKVRSMSPGSMPTMPTSTGKSPKAYQTATSNYNKQLAQYNAQYQAQQTAAQNAYDKTDAALGKAQGALTKAAAPPSDGRHEIASGLGGGSAAGGAAGGSAGSVTGGGAGAGGGAVSAGGGGGSHVGHVTPRAASPSIGGGHVTSSPPVLGNNPNTDIGPYATPQGNTDGGSLVPPGTVPGGNAPQVGTPAGDPGGVGSAVGNTAGVVGGGASALGAAAMIPGGIGGIGGSGGSAGSIGSVTGGTSEIGRVSGESSLQRGGVLGASSEEAAAGRGASPAAGAAAEEATPSSRMPMSGGMGGAGGMGAGEGGAGGRRYVAPNTGEEETGNAGWRESDAAAARAGTREERGVAGAARSADEESEEHRKSMLWEDEDEWLGDDDIAPGVLGD